MSANLAGSGSATTLARSDHDHFAQGWSGSSASGLTVTNAAGAALRGLSTATGATPGVFGSGQSSIGVGILLPFLGREEEDTSGSDDDPEPPMPSR